ncbi:MAG: hypothetical protein FJY11_00900 [Bacteroidetes bacterium]|nr:hypothetical protein [Bacteroidota bacterium]
MSRAAVIILIVLAVACRKEKIPLSGTATIDNRLYESDQAFYALGFSFSSASLVRTDRTPSPDISLLAETDAGGNITTVTFNGSPGFEYYPFARYGEYATVAEAKTAFGSLKTFDPSLHSWVELARPLAVNQVWLFITPGERYAKLRIVEIETGVRDDRPYAECTFEWAFQPAGTTTFP